VYNVIKYNTKASIQTTVYFNHCSEVFFMTFLRMTIQLMGVWTNHLRTIRWETVHWVLITGDNYLAKLFNSCTFHSEYFTGWLL